MRRCVSWQHTGSDSYLPPQSEKVTFFFMCSRFLSQSVGIVTVNVPVCVSFDWLPVQGVLCFATNEGWNRLHPTEGPKKRLIEDVLCIL